MLSSPLLDHSGTDKGPQFGLGEVLNGEYRVSAVEADNYGRIIHKCTRLSSGEDVSLFYEGRREQSSAWPSHYSSPTIPSTTGLHPAGCLEVQLGTDVFVYAVLAAQREKDSHQHEPEYENLRPFGEPQRRPGPAGVRATVFRRGDCHLEIDIPANCCGKDAAFFFIGCVVVLVFMCVWVAIAVPSGFAFGPLVGILSLTFTALFCLILGFVFIMTVAAVFGHENLTITPTEFRIKRVLEVSPQNRDSVNHAFKASKEVTCLDLVFCKQVAGQTKDLLQAKVKVNFMRGEDNSAPRLQKYLVLLEGVLEHQLGHSLPDGEMDWIMEEVNAVLENIKAGENA